METPRSTPNHILAGGNFKTDFYCESEMPYKCFIMVVPRPHLTPHQTPPWVQPPKTEAETIPLWIQFQSNVVTRNKAFGELQIK